MIQSRSSRLIWHALVAVALFSVAGSLIVRLGYAPVSRSLVLLSATLGWVFIALCAFTGWQLVRSQYTGLRAVRLLCLVLIISGAAEWVGVSTGRLFGEYRYEPVMGPSVWGVPWAIPLAWWGMLAPAHLAAALAAGACTGSPASIRLMQAAWVGAWMASWDLVLEPVMSASHPLLARWTWLTPSGRPPVENGLSWFAVSMLIGWLMAPPLGAVRRLPGSLDRLAWIQVLFPLSMGIVFDLPVWRPASVWIAVWAVVWWMRQRARDWYNQADRQAEPGG